MQQQSGASAPQRQPRTGSPRTGSRRSAKLQSIIAAATDLIRNHGYGAVTYRSVAAAADVVPGLVQYYFPVLDDLFIAVLRQSTDQLVDGFHEATQSDQPLRAIWRYASDPAGTALLMEFMALAKNRPAVGTAIGEGGERVRHSLLAAVTPKWADYGLDRHQIPPSAVIFALTALPRMIYLEEALGTTTGHAEIATLINDLLDRLEPNL